MARQRLTKEQHAEVFSWNAEQDDCGVIAIMRACDLTYPEALEVATRHGYGNNNGMMRTNIHAAIEEFKTLREVELPRQTTPAIFAMAHEVGTFLIHTNGHVQVLKDGDLLNSGEGDWSSPVQAIKEVIS